jgi:hypothetical protein
LIDAERFTGKAKKNSFVFQDHKLSRIKLSIDSQTELRDYIKINFAKNDYSEGLLSLLEGLGVYNSKFRTIGIDPERYMKGNTLFLFDLTQAFSGTTGDTFQPVQRGNLRLHVEFTTATSTNLICYFLFFFDSEILITADRQVVFDYST